MKRGPESFEAMSSSGAEMKRSRAAGNKLEVRILIPSKIAGSIIGKAGANIQHLRTTNNANVRVPDCEGPERVMNIQVDEAQTAINVIEQTLPYMSEDMANSPAGQTPDINSGPQEIRLLIHQSIVGGIIGKGGSKIKEIREESGANIKVYGTCAPQSSDRCVVVQGTNEKIVAALHPIMHIVVSTEIKGGIQPYDPYNFDGFYAHEYGGYGTERDVMGYNGMPRIPRGRGRGNFGGGRGRGNYGGCHGGMPAGGFGMNNFGNPGEYISGDSEDTGPVQTTKVTIPKDMGGAIIGPGGSRIRRIRMDSKADIKIAEAVEGADERVITISGTERNIQTAQYLLQQCVKEFAGPVGGGGGNNSGFGSGF